MTELTGKNDPATWTEQERRIAFHDGVVPGALTGWRRCCIATLRSNGVQTLVLLRWSSVDKRITEGKIQVPRYGNKFRF